MKRTVIFAALLGLVLSAAAFGEVQDFGAFTIDVPAGWTAAKDGETVGITKNDNSAAVSITYDSTDGMTIKDLAAAFVESLKGKDLKEDNGTYTFTFTNANGVESSCVLSGDDKNYALVVMTGIESAPEEINAMVGSLTQK